MKLRGSGDSSSKASDSKKKNQEEKEQLENKEDQLMGFSDTKFKPKRLNGCQVILHFVLLFKIRHHLKKNVYVQEDQMKMN